MKVHFSTRITINTKRSFIQFSSPKFLPSVFLRFNREQHNRLSDVQTGGENDIPLDALTRSFHFAIEGWVSDHPGRVPYVPAQFVQSSDGSYNRALCVCVCVCVCARACVYV